MNRSWSFVLIGALFEVGWVIGLKHSATALDWSLTILAIIISFILLIKATSTLPVGTVYAVFTGLGTAGTVLMDMLIFGDPFQLIKIGLIVMLLIGVIGLKVVTGESKTDNPES